MLRIFLLVVGLIAVLAQDPQCQTCMENYAYCVDERRFYLCMDGEHPAKADGQPLACADDEVCTNSDNVCEKKTDLPQLAANSIQQVCSSGAVESACGTCGSSKFTCASRNHFAFCKSDGSSIVRKCNEGELCSMDMYKAIKKFCASEVVLTFLNYSITCSNTEPIVPTAAPTTTQAPVDLTAKCNASGRTDPYFFLLNDDDVSCKAYIFCEVINSTMTAQSFTCKDGYYSSEVNRCVAEKPSNCPVATTDATSAAESSSPSSSATESSSSPSSATESSSSSSSATESSSSSSTDSPVTDTSSAPPSEEID